ncbi:rhodanese-like domain-containing protein [Skermania piniformis]|uniref:Rhodanese-like domain-containing protein n=1 Tax=Skermania pinensis TaxID=39122 RepID=A0ABX8S8V0_9ACTN|nr:rhodanese-like domain-containing protein [Skermania piniformis]QXQ14242.1 rhodanese-like domain-containing protein [Skermania piniformis]
MSYAGDVTPQQAWDLLRDRPDAVLVDVRTEQEWQTIGVPDISELSRPVHFVEWVDAQGSPNPAFLAQLQAAGVATGPVVFICRSGQRSEHAAVAATAAGIAPSYNLSGGFEGEVGPLGQRDVNGWKVLGLPWTRR